MPVKDPVRRREIWRKCYYGASGQSAKAMARTKRYRERNMAHLRAAVGDRNWCYVLGRVAWRPVSLANLDRAIEAHDDCDGCAKRRAGVAQVDRAASF